MTHHVIHKIKRQKKYIENIKMAKFEAPSLKIEILWQYEFLKE